MLVVAIGRLAALVFTVMPLAFAWPAGATGRSNSVLASQSATTFKYGPDPLQTVTVDPSGVPNSPAVILVHGGGFRSSPADVASVAPQATSLEADGASVFIVNYRDDSAAPAFPDQVDDIVTGTQWVIANGAAYDANVNDLAIVGGSAGGLLVGDAAENLNAAAAGTVKTVMTLSSTGNLAMELSYWSQQTGKEATKHLDNILPALGCSSVSTCPTTLENQWSPDQNLTAAECPNHWLIYETQGDYEPPAGTEAMDGALNAVGCNVTDTILPGNGHGYSLFPSAELAFLSALEPPAITSPPSATDLEGTALDFAVTTTGYPLLSLTENGTLPQGVSFADNGNGTGSLSGTPAIGTAGTYPVTFTASDGIGSPAVQQFTLTITQAPSITSSASATFPEGSGGSFEVKATGSPTPTLTETGSLPQGVSFVDGGGGTATLAGTPQAETVGSYSLTITADNGQGTPASQTFALTISGLDVTTTSLPPGARGSPYFASLQANGGILPFKWKRTGTLPDGLTLSSSGVLSGTPSPQLVAGTYPISVVVTDTSQPKQTARATLSLTLS
ncbi:MAG: putative Ig domain-containing protein [Acidimicrobiales bacterium]|nr:putative Ig domain-containing protein [Acidimicrobiales bacterium]